MVGSVCTALVVCTEFPEGFSAIEVTELVASSNRVERKAATNMKRRKKRRRTEDLEVAVMMADSNGSQIVSQKYL